MDTKTKICTKCGIKKPATIKHFYKNNRKKGKSKLDSWCKSCCSKNNLKYYGKNKIQRKQSMKKRWIQLKSKYIKYKGGKCSICGYDKCIAALDFHHIDPSIKENRIGHLPQNKVYKELDKCILICSNCHRELHFLNNDSNT